MSASVDIVGQRQDGAREWLDAAVTSIGEVFEVTFAVPPPEVGSEHRVLEGEARGASLALVTDREDVELIFAGTQECAEGAARLMFMMEEGDPVSDDDVGDALGEITNMVAGGVKDRLSWNRSIRLGLPVQFNGSIKAGGTEESRFVWLTCEGHQFQLGVFHRPLSS